MARQIDPGAVETTDPWPMEDGRTLKYLNTQGDVFYVKSSTAGRKNIEIDGQVRNVQAYVVETSLDGRIVRREVYVKEGINTYKIKQTQVVEGVTIVFAPPIRIAGSERSAGCEWNSDGTATVSSARIVKPAEYRYSAKTAVTMHGSIRFNDQPMFTFTAVTSIDFFKDDIVDEGGTAFSGTETIQYIVGVGPKRIGQGEGFDQNALLLQEVTG